MLYTEREATTNKSNFKIKASSRIRLLGGRASNVIKNQVRKKTHDVMKKQTTKTTNS